MDTIYSKLQENAKYIIESYGEMSTVLLAKEFNCNPGTIYLFLKDNGVDIKKRSDNYGNTDRFLEEIKSLHSQGVSAYSISKKINLSKYTILKIGNKHGLDFSSKYKLYNPIRMKDQEDLIKELYEQGMTGNQISKKLGYSPSQITEFLNRLGYELTKYKYETDINFFDTIDSQAKAYVLGFWY